MDFDIQWDTSVSFLDNITNNKKKKRVVDMTDEEVEEEYNEYAENFNI